MGILCSAGAKRETHPFSTGMPPAQKPIQTTNTVRHTPKRHTVNEVMCSKNEQNTKLLLCIFETHLSNQTNLFALAFLNNSPDWKASDQRPDFFSAWRAPSKRSSCSEESPLGLLIPHRYVPQVDTRIFLVILFAAREPNGFSYKSEKNRYFQ